MTTKDPDQKIQRMLDRNPKLRVTETWIADTEWYPEMGMPEYRIGDVLIRCYEARVQGSVEVWARCPTAP